MEKNTKEIVCPETGKHNAILYVYPHKYGGIWECEVCEVSDSHECEEFEPYEGIENYMDFGGVQERTFYLNICVDCGESHDYEPEEPERDCND